MGIRNLFSVPEGEKITDKDFARIMIASVCSILLCMVCLVSTTWAWFTVTIENPGNVLEIASVETNVRISKDGVTIDAEENDAYALQPGAYTVNLKLSSNARNVTGLEDAPGATYVIMKVQGSDWNAQYYFTFVDSAEEKLQQFSVNGESVEVSFSVSWSVPAAAVSVDGVLEIGSEIAEPTT